ncbi:hypothetical protein FD47_GL002852 [Lentilactobacillus parafarraginis DSM 18390 = JCM 14109]|uniref:PucR C-terminal helix-turn-helix domain-containing protein n=2 Tax=Lentilactobacillus parafarraginis TaxID=390842 RepID=A0A0R1YMD9_9LACO|nr:hypothetical protein FD47_GL002852 [Lentilactobacillus parafarraginis DSM 18390 = JCM 14109]
MVMATPDINNWIVPGELVLTSLFGLSDAEQESLVTGLRRNRSTGLIVKKNDYLADVPKQVIEYSKKNDLPLLELRNITYREVIKKFDHLKSLDLASREKFVDPQLEKDIQETFRGENNPEGLYRLRQRLKLSVSGKVRVIMTQQKDFPGEEFKQLVNASETFIVNCAIGFIDHNLVILANDRSELQEFKHNVSEKLPNCQLLSSSLTSLKELHEVYRQMMNMRKLVNTDHLKAPFISIDSLGVDKLFISQSSRFLEKVLVNSQLKLLQTQQPVLFESLRAYFLTNQNITQAAKRLFIHPKSLAYRLHKVEQILDVNLNDADQSLYLNLTTKFLALRRAGFYV